jgi:hypothetical protein
MLRADDTYAGISDEIGHASACRKIKSRLAKAHVSADSAPIVELNGAVDF